MFGGIFANLGARRSIARNLIIFYGLGGNPGMRVDAPDLVQVYYFI